MVDLKPQDVYTNTIELDKPTGTLVGTLLMPPSMVGDHVALILAGSGPTDPDGNPAQLPGRKGRLKRLASGLADASMASLIKAGTFHRDASPICGEGVVRFGRSIFGKMDGRVAIRHLSP